MFFFVNLGVRFGRLRRFGSLKFAPILELSDFCFDLSELCDFSFFLCLPTCLQSFSRAAQLALITRVRWLSIGLLPVIIVAVSCQAAFGSRPS